MLWRVSGLFHPRGFRRSRGGRDRIRAVLIPRGARAWRLAAIAALAGATLGCGSPSGPTPTVSAAPTNPVSPISSEPPSAPAMPTVSPELTPTASPAPASTGLDPTQPDQVALALYAGGGTPATGRLDCLTTTASCPLTTRLTERLPAFPDASQAHNAGGGGSDPFCRGCQVPFANLTVSGSTADPTGAIVYVVLTDGGTTIPLAVIEVQEEGGGYLVDDVDCVSGGEPDLSTSLYAITDTDDTGCPTADAG